MSKLKMPIHTQPFTTASYFPFDKVAVDTIGPLPPDEHENKYLTLSGLAFCPCDGQKLKNLKLLYLM